MTDYFAVFTIHELDGLLLKKVAPLAVEFPYELSNRSEYARLMRCNIRRGKELKITLDSAYLKEEIISANYDLQRYLIESINGHLQKDKTDFGSKVFNHLLSNAYLLMPRSNPRQPISMSAPVRFSENFTTRAAPFNK
jgi:hypothetical protein